MHGTADGGMQGNGGALRRCIAAVRQRARLPELREAHAHAIRAWVPLSNPMLAKHLIFALASLPYSSSSAAALAYAEALFSLIDSPGIFTVNTMIRAHAESARPRPALALHARGVHARGLRPDSHTYPFLLKACARLLDLRHGESVHSLAVRNACASSVFVQNSLLHLYASCGAFESAHQLFDQMPQRNLVSWNSAINAFALNARPNEALTLFQQMLVDEEVKPDGFTLVSLLTTCAELGALSLGRRAHAYILKRGFFGNSHVGNGLIDAYSKCGAAGDARRVFDGMPSRTVVSWTSLIVGLAVNGFGRDALHLFEAMEAEGLSPTEITFVGVLYACSHCGLVERGFGYFNSMKDGHGIVPRIEHHGCIVDLLGRAGMVERAHEYILQMPVEPNAVIWRTLLGACAMHRRVAVGEAAWSRLSQLDPGHSGDYVLLSNLYASSRRWAEVQKLRKVMIRGGVKKTPGHSLLELGNRVHHFVMGDRSHPETDLIYEKLEEIAGRLRREGYVARTVDVLADIQEEEKETALRFHSERLAIAFALVQSPPGGSIRIVKNLRVCEDCHLAIKIISKAYEREIVLRDRSRFHHFRDGVCSCKDYW